MGCIIYLLAKSLTHWGRVTHICISKLIIIGSDSGLSPGRRQAIIWTNDGILLIRTFRTNFSEIVSEIHTFSSKKMRSKCRQENGGHLVSAWMCIRLNTRLLQSVIPKSRFGMLCNLLPRFEQDPIQTWNDGDWYQEVLYLKLIYISLSFQRFRCMCDVLELQVIQWDGPFIHTVIQYITLRFCCTLFCCVSIIVSWHSVI